MLIIGAKGFAKEVLEVFNQLDKLEGIAFYDDVNLDIGSFLYGRFPILKNETEVKDFFKKHGEHFTIGIGNPVLREKLFWKFGDWGGAFQSSISPLARMGAFGNSIGVGCNIMTGTIITNDVKIGTGVLINLNCTIGHDSILSDFIELSPGVHISGNCTIGSFSNIGTNATILPGVKIGENVMIGAGAVVNRDVPDNSVAVGIPAKVIKSLEPLNKRG